MFYLIVFWLLIGFTIGSILATLYWLACFTDLIKKDRLFLKDAQGKWIPKNPPTQ